MENIYTIGMDCGATHTKVAVWREDKIVFEEDNWPGLNMDLISGVFSVEVLRDEIEKIREYENADWVIAMAGLDDSNEVNKALSWWRKNLEELGIMYKDLDVMGDIDLVLWSGSPEGIGVALIAGTGSNCLAKDTDGRLVKVGGMSHVMSDEGSGYALGSRCLHIITKMSDGRLPVTAMLKQTLDWYVQEDVVALKHFLVSSSALKYEVARCAGILLSAAKNGDEEAVNAANDEAGELVKMVETANNTLALEKPLNLFMAGSLLKNDYYLKLIEEKLAISFPEQKIEIVRPILGVLNFRQWRIMNT